MKTAENAVVMLSSKHKATIPKALENYKKIVAKYTDAEPMAGRLSRPDFSTNSTTGLDKAKTHVQFNIRTSNHSRFDKAEEGAEKLTLDDVYRQVKLKLVKEVAAVLAHKKSMKIKAGVKFEIGKIKIDVFQDEHTEKDKDYIEDKQTLIWSTNPKPCTKANINSQIDSQFAYLKKRFDKLSDYVEGSGWIIYRWHYIFVECLTVKPQRGSSYIPTPAKYSNPKCCC